MNAFLKRPVVGEWPYVRIDATYVKVRQDHRITSAVDVNSGRRREVPGMITALIRAARTNASANPNER